MLARKERLQLKSPPREWISAALKAGPFRPAVLTNEAVLAMTEIAIPHTDPADTLLAATARIYGLTLVTADEQLAKGTGYSVLRNE